MEYEALLAGLKLAREMWVKRLLIISDFQLLVSQINGNFIAKDKNMAPYLKRVIDLLTIFGKFVLTQILRLENAPSKLTICKDFELKIMPIENLSRSFISKGEDVMWVKSILSWTLLVYPQAHALQFRCLLVLLYRFGDVMLMITKSGN